jgi:hypothetical protein
MEALSRLSMFLCLVKRSFDVSVGLITGICQEVVFGLGCRVADKTGRGRSGGRASSYEVTPSGSDGGPGGGRQIV